MNREERERAKQEFMARHPERFGSGTKTIQSNAMIYIFIIIGVVFLFIGFSTKNKGEEIKATISNIDIVDRVGDEDDSKTVYVDYTYKGNKYKNIALSYSDFTMKEGKEINIYVDPNEPTKIYGWKTSLLFGAFFTGFGVFVLILIKRKEASTYRT